MSPAPGTAVNQLKQLIYYHLDNDAVDNANFLAGRLHALDARNPDAAHLLALTYHRLRRPKAAYDYAQKHGANGRHLGCAFVFALSCQELGKYHEGITALEKARASWIGNNNWGKHTETSRRHLPDAAAVNSLLGRLWRGHGDQKRAGDCYIEAHKDNPFTWDAFQALCDMGANLDPANSFQLSPDIVATFTSTTSSTTTQQDAVKDEIVSANGALAQSSFNHQNVLTPSNDPFNPAVIESQGPGNFLLPKIKSRSIFNNGPKAPALPHWETPTANCVPADNDADMGGISSDVQQVVNEEQAPPAPARRSRTIQQRLGLNAERDNQKVRPPTLRSHLRGASGSADVEDASHAKPAVTNHKRTISGHTSNGTSHEPEAVTSQPRRSNRLFHQITGTKSSSRTQAESASSLAGKREEARKVKATGVKGRGTSTVGRVVSGNRAVKPPLAPGDKEPRLPSKVSIPPAAAAAHRQVLEDTSAQDLAALEAVLSTFRSIGAAYYALGKYATQTAIDGFKALPTAQRETPWVLSQLGKAYYEASDYTAAETCFARMLKLQPTRIEDTEVYSTVLWQLKKPVQLAFLAHTLRDLDFQSPQTWCTIGNAFSLSREHEQAIACFKRATQVDAGFSYAWTLMGHELLTNEEFDAALSAFRKGVGSERRGYGAWYGLGKCYERMGKWEEAEKHYRIASDINPSNSVLAVCIGVALEKLHHPKAALAQYSQALGLAPNSALARFKKARVLMTLRLYSDALVELEVLRNLAPDEANVFFLLGKCYKGLGQRAASVRSFTTALNLDAKAAQYIKEAMESLDESDDDDDMDDD